MKKTITFVLDEKLDQELRLRLGLGGVKKGAISKYFNKLVKEDIKKNK